jgi:hypothetical protein
VYGELTSAYEGYPVGALVVLGGGTLLAVGIGAGVLGSTQTKSDREWVLIEESLEKMRQHKEGAQQ